jgi:hypothetical protein
MATPFWQRETKEPWANNRYTSPERLGLSSGYGSTGLLPASSGCRYPQFSFKPFDAIRSGRHMIEGGSKLTVGPNIKLKGVEITDCDAHLGGGEAWSEATMDSASFR